MESKLKSSQHKFIYIRVISEVGKFAVNTCYSLVLPFINTYTQTLKLMLQNCK